ncbi:hypothetical protein E2562_022305 [Oryza meyeriana var. granulata]|uniref:Uncharacterized protein n=1 Tax=Oryza meyeriana var. granulata TaxID=110450 RepID=A0A6G1D698_9ORYZ|nr:hypothetical protein E2562_022305 [Oryza meyeriana var. granulata]
MANASDGSISNEDVEEGEKSGGERVPPSPPLRRLALPGPSLSRPFLLPFPPTMPPLSAHMLGLSSRSIYSGMPCRCGEWVKAGFDK